MRKFKVNHHSVGVFSADHVITDEQIAAAAKANRVVFDVESWLKSGAVTEVQPTPEEVAEEQKAAAAKAAADKAAHDKAVADKAAADKAAEAKKLAETQGQAGRQA